jgi:predicted unusual protein kinase regulating ubiquinone biosynthesis (AarF/ABC1/UbiB family)
MSDDQLPPAVRSLLTAGLQLARSTTSGRIAFAQAHNVVDPAAVPARAREAVMAELDAAAAAVKPLDAKAAARVLKDAWGSDHAKIVDDLDLGAPIAVTAGAQVHRGTLDGEAVAVKILRPGVRDSIRSDLGLLETLAGPAGAAFPAADVGALIAEVRERILDELDLEHEAGTQRAAARALRRHASIRVPSPVTELCHENVLVTAFVAGPTLADGIPADADTGAIARALLRAVIGLPRTAGLIHADPEPGNVILDGDGSVTLVDFGAGRRIQTARLDRALDALQAMRDDDEGAFATAVMALGILPYAESCATALRILRAVGGELLTGTARLDADALLALGERVRGHEREGFGLALRATIDPQDVWAARGLGTLVATLGRLGAEEDWVALTLAAGREGC